MKIQGGGTHKTLLSTYCVPMPGPFLSIDKCLPYNECPSEVDETGDSCFSSEETEFQVCKVPMFGEARI